MNKCYKCNYRIETKTHYCCPKCGEKFWSSKEEFTEYQASQEKERIIKVNIKNKKKKIALKCILFGLLSGFVLGIIIGSVVSVYSVFKHATSDGKYIEETYCTEVQYTGTETCDTYDNCSRDWECIGKWEKRYIPIAKRVKENIKLYSSFFPIIGIFIGLLATFAYSDKIHHEELDRKREEEKINEK